MNWAVERIGPERAKTSYPWKQFLDNGVRLAFGTDYPVEPITPFRGVYAAVTRKNEAGTKEYYPEQKLTIAAGAGGLHHRLSLCRVRRERRRERWLRGCWPTS